MRLHSRKADAVLNFLGPPQRTCAGYTRRIALQVGAFGFGGWSLVDLLRAESSASIRKSTK